MRRSRGEGSVYRRKNGLWVARYEAAGKRKYLYGDRLREKVSSRVANLAPEADTMLVEEYLDRWFPTVKNTVKDRTWQRHEEVVRLHLEPVLGDVRLSRLNALEIQELYRTKLESGLSPRTVQIVHTTLHKALKQAVRWSLVEANVTEAVTSPRPSSKEIRVLTSEEVKRLLYVVRGERFETLYVLAVTTGMRQGELLGLKWEDVDLDAGTLRVRRTVWEGGSDGSEDLQGQPFYSASQDGKRDFGGAEGAGWEVGMGLLDKERYPRELSQPDQPILVAAAGEARTPEDPVP